MKGNLAIGIDFGGTNTKLGVIDKKGSVLLKKVIRTTAHAGSADRSRREPGGLSLVEKVISDIEEIVAMKRFSKLAMLGIGIGVPGLIDSEKGMVRFLVNIPDWRQVPLAKIFKKRLKLPTFIDNDANVMALGELRYGAGRGFKNLVCITLGTGVGGGLIIDGKLYRGGGFSAGEIGHIPINANGPLCACGGRGCLERYIGNRHIVESALRKIRAKTFKTKITALIKSDYSRLTPEVLSRAARMKDALAIEVWKEAAGHLGMVLVGLVNLLNPDAIIIGGGVANAGKLLFEPLVKTVKKFAMSPAKDMVKIIPAKLADNAGLIGARALIEEKLR